jgi:hypothetical protein
MPAPEVYATGPPHGESERVAPEHADRTTFAGRGMDDEPLSRLRGFSQAMTPRGAHRRRRPGEPARRVLPGLARTLAATAERLGG